MPNRQLSFERFKLLSAIGALGYELDWQNFINFFESNHLKFDKNVSIRPLIRVQQDDHLIGNKVLEIIDSEPVSICQEISSFKSIDNSDFQMEIKELILETVSFFCKKNRFIDYTLYDDISY